MKKSKDKKDKNDKDMKPKVVSKTTNDSPMAKLLEKQKVDVPKIGDVVKGKVVSVSKNEVIVDLGPLGSGIIRGREWFDVMDTYADFEAGDTIEASVMYLENENGQVDLSLKKAGREKSWDEIQRLKEDSEVVEIVVQEANKGGVIANVRGIQAFLPVSQLNSEHYPRVEGGDKNAILEKLEKLVGKEFKVKILDYDQEDEKLIISEKEAEAEKLREEISKYKVGDKVSGKITGIVDFGVFIKFGEKEELEGLIHISELAWKRIDHPRDIVKMNDSVEAEIISIDGNRISLSMKKLQEDPWVKSAKKYKIGQKVKGNITKVTPFGAFVQLDKDIHGLAHISELSENDESPAKLLDVGETKDFKILSIEPEDHRLGLALANARSDKKKKPKKKKEKKEEKKPKKKKKKVSKKK